MNKKIRVTFEQENKKAIVTMEFGKRNKVHVDVSFVPEVHGDERDEYLQVLCEFLGIFGTEN